LSVSWLLEAWLLEAWSTVHLNDELLLYLLRVLIA
jgi:hypothetical protein